MATLSPTPHTTQIRWCKQKNFSFISIVQKECVRERYIDREIEKEREIEREGERDRDRERERQRAVLSPLSLSHTSSLSPVSVSPLSLCL